VKVLSALVYVMVAGTMVDGVGAILIAPLAARFPTRSVLAIAVIVFGLMTTILLIVDAATGGSIRAPNGPVRYGNWNPDAIFVSRFSDCRGSI
jgi:hypothetical protein